MQHPRSVIADSVLNIRFDLELTQIEIAKMLNIEQSTVHRWERGHTMPSVLYFLKLVKLLPKKDQVEEIKHVLSRI